MKTTCLIFMWLMAYTTFAQQGNYDSAQELRGSGRTVRETPKVGRFDAIEIQQFPAKVTVDADGTESSVSIVVDDNLRPLLRVANNAGTLTLSFADPQNRSFWISKANVEVNITTPSLKRFKYGSNSDVRITGLQGDSFSLANDANGNVTLAGDVKALKVISLANGTVDAEKLTVQTANVITQANATVRVNARQVSVVKQAFANVINIADTPQPPTANSVAVRQTAQKSVSIRFRNESPLAREVTLISYAPGEVGNETNSFTLAPYASLEKHYLNGTAVYVATSEQVNLVMQGGRLRGKPFLTVSTNDEGRTVKLVR